MTEFVWDILNGSRVSVDSYRSNVRWDLLSMIDGSVSSVLELGCGVGATGKVIKQKFSECFVCGVEMDQEAASLAKGEIDDVICSNLDSLDFSESFYWGAVKFDCVLAGDVLEHLNNPWGVLASLKPFLSDDCQVLVSLPNVGNALLIAGLASGQWEYEEQGLLDVTHLRFFTRLTAERLLSETGFQVEMMARLYDQRLVALESDSVPERFNVTCGKIEFKGLSYDEWEDLRTFQYLIKARPAV